MRVRCIVRGATLRGWEVSPNRRSRRQHRMPWLRPFAGAAIHREGTLHSPRRYLEGCLKTFASGGGNNVRSGSGKHLSNEFHGLAHYIGEARSKARVFKRPNGSSQRRQVFRCHSLPVTDLTTGPESGTFSGVASVPSNAQRPSYGLVFRGHLPGSVFRSAVPLRRSAMPRGLTFMASAAAATPAAWRSAPPSAAASVPA